MFKIFFVLIIQFQPTSEEARIAYALEEGIINATGIQNNYDVRDLLDVLENSPSCPTGDKPRPAQDVGHSEQRSKHSVILILVYMHTLGFCHVVVLFAGMRYYRQRNSGARCEDEAYGPCVCKCIFCAG